MDVFPKLCKVFPGITATFLHLGMVLVGYYHQYAENIFINTTFLQSGYLEKIGNTLLIPSQYLCEGKLVSYDLETNTFTLKQRFQYETHKKVYSPAAITFFTPGVILGSACKSLALLFPETRERHKKLKKHLQSTKVLLNNDTYRKLGMEINDWRKGEILEPQGYKRRPGDEKILLPDKEGLKAIASILSEEKIPFWVDCGTCIGTFRYGGIIPWDNDLDLSILVDDFENARNALKKLDPKKFVVQDWSGRGRPGTYLRVYIKENHSHIDIYCNDIDPVNKTITYIIGQIDSHFMAEAWKKRERRQAANIPFDVIFPLKKGTFDGIEVPVPNQAARFIAYKYGPNINPTRIYSEETEKYEKDLTHPYWEIPLAQ